jgi:hypothetical protein
VTRSMLLVADVLNNTVAMSRSTWTICLGRELGSCACDWPANTLVTLSRKRIISPAVYLNRNNTLSKRPERLPCMQMVSMPNDLPTW